MTTYKDFKFLTAATTTVSSTTFTNTICDGMTLQITGTHSAATILIEGQVSPLSTSTDWVAISAIDLSDFSTTNAITDNGIYQTSIQGISQIRIRISAITSGTVTAIARFYIEGGK
jgi:hypothetical protein